MANTTPSDSKSPAEEQLDQAQLIEETGSVRTPNAKHLIHCLNIIGQVEGHNVLPEDTKTTKYEHVLPALVAIEQDRSIEGLLILLNTMGGDVEAGLAIAEVIAGMQTPTVSLVVGGGHSIGIPLAVSADVSLIVPSASMTVHPVRTSGLVLGVPQTAIYFSKIQERITGFITSHSRISKARLENMMLNTQEMATDMGTVISGAEAVECGLIDRLGSLRDAIDALYHRIETQELRPSGNAKA
ncbi:ClpP family protease [Ruminococcus callidus]|jgi:ATP-dependent protease ClpP protease subunit|uniref:ClpP family protease n=1 Tax=Ruminococcus callidus TaxID=40519 RepID=UPI00266C9DAA|nr:ATP-dependent Clp protease proteolytic subunit [uncultured Ruminococcus sp.]